MSDWPKITVVTPSYNQDQFLEETIQSVLTQEYPNLEYIVMDGGSTDGSAALIQRHEHSLTYWVSQKDKGQANAINSGFARATGDILCWLNSDDLFVPGALKKVGEHFRNHEIDFLYGDGWVFWDKSRRPKRHVRPGKLAPEVLPVRDLLQQPSTFWRRAVWEKAGPLTEERHFTFDWEFFLRVSAHFPMCYLETPLSEYRFHAQHKSGSGGRKRAEEIVGVMQQYAPKPWADLYAQALPFYPSLERCKRRWRRFYFLPFLATNPGCVQGADLSKLKQVTSVL